MRHTFRTLVHCGVAASLLLPLSGITSLAHADDADTPTIVVASKARLAANDCVSLVARHEGARGSIQEKTPSLLNRCDYDVVVSYCIDDDGRASLSCAAVDERATQSRRIAAQQALALDTAPAEVVDNSVNWVACRSLPGVSSRLVDGGSAGQCRAPAPVMQALAREAAPPAP